MGDEVGSMPKCSSFRLRITLLEEFQFKLEVDTPHVLFEFHPEDFDLSWLEFFKKYYRKLYKVVLGSTNFRNLRISDYRVLSSQNTWNLRDKVRHFIDVFPPDKRFYCATFHFGDIGTHIRVPPTRPSPVVQCPPPPKISLQSLGEDEDESSSESDDSTDGGDDGIFRPGTLLKIKAQFASQNFDNSDSRKTGTYVLPTSSSRYHATGASARASRFMHHKEALKEGIRKLTEMNAMRVNRKSTPTSKAKVVEHEIVTLSSSPKEGNSPTRERDFSPEELMLPPRPPRSPPKKQKLAPRPIASPLTPLKSRAKWEPQGLSGVNTHDFEPHIQLPELRRNFQHNDETTSMATSMWSQDSRSDIIRAGVDPNKQIKNGIMQRLIKKVDNDMMLRVQMELQKVYKNDKWMRIASRIPLTTNVLQLVFLDDNDSS